MAFPICITIQIPLSFTNTTMPLPRDSLVCHWISRYVEWFHSGSTIKDRYKSIFVYVYVPWTTNNFEWYVLFCYFIWVEDPPETASHLVNSIENFVWSFVDVERRRKKRHSTLRSIKTIEIANTYSRLVALKIWLLSALAFNGHSNFCNGI